MTREDARRAARHARAQLELGQTRDAAWLAILAVETDESEALGWALLARIVLEATEDPLATVTTRYALELGVPEPERALIERMHRVDLWTRGLVDHDDHAPILPLSAFDDASAFTETPRLDRWLGEQMADFDDASGCARAVLRMVAAFSEAYVVPETDDNPLRADGWTPTKAFAAWRDPNPVIGLGEPPAPTSIEDDAPDVQLLSDYRIEQEIVELGAQGSFQLARDRATLWAQLRHGRVKPLSMLVRVLHAGEWHDERDEAVRRMLDLGSHDLNELEDARVVLGELELWDAQLQILDQMDHLAPGHSVILANRGVAKMQLGAANDGATDLEAALEADPDCGPALANLGLHRMRQDEYVAARALLERAVEVAPKQAQVRVYLAACKNNQGDRAGAMAELESALKIEPEHPQAKQLLEELLSRGPQA